ncbi:dihydropteroate synthase [Chitinivibrio alkaliphilus]|uniref:Dihydropteroate synthase n=1 Tax=Chitinivibrio alkaliphilus ACht1 TaxID=1313304 RepID=U7DD57_9BACT|nr:dihydropteroate synthase [Chitinivibrio alkaliphilus]ERP38811.1 dihydropteroate synthase [Chitinivibrio alkaliphilus ACht1]
MGNEPRPWNVMGILNVTPDSFYDGGTYTDCVAERAQQMYDDGAVVIDVGGESTRPGSLPVSVQEELDRVVPAVEEILRTVPVQISVDTTKATVARAALRAGATMVNDVSGGRFDPDLPRVAAQEDASVVVMHSRKTPRDMQEDPSYKSVLEEVAQELQEGVTRYVSAGVAHHNIIIDPGIGFAKTYFDNIALLGGLSSLSLPYPLLIGTSRKSFLGAITGRDAADRLAPSLATVGHAYTQGVRWFRVHDVAETVDYLKTLDFLTTVSPQE